MIVVFTMCITCLVSIVEIFIGMSEYENTTICGN